MVTQKDLDQGRLYPPLSSIRSVSFDIAVQTVQEAYDDGTASLDPQPIDIEKFVWSKMYSYYYDSFMPITYDWPEDAGWRPSDEQFAKFGDMA